MHDVKNSKSQVNVVKDSDVRIIRHTQVHWGY